MLVLYLKQAEYDEKYIMKAINIYHKYFSKIDEKG